MTRTVESPRGGHASLTITPGDDGVVYLRAANVVSEVTVPLLAADLLAAIADELGVIDEQQVREQVAREIEARRGSAATVEGRLAVGVAASIARGEGS